MRSPTPGVLALIAAVSLGAACALTQPGSVDQHRWWAGLGPVLPHDTFPGDCALCHDGGDWQSLRDDFSYDHEAETGVPLEGAHEAASCLRCHNDRGPVEVFASQGCAGCHEDIHLGELGGNCTSCHQQETWWPSGMVARHNRTRFPLMGVHAVTSCRACHPGAQVGNFLPTDTDCLSCHVSDLARTTNHVGLGWVNRCDRCHFPTSWNQAEVD